MFCQFLFMILCLSFLYSFADALEGRVLVSKGEYISQSISRGPLTIKCTVQSDRPVTLVFMSNETFTSWEKCGVSCLNKTSTELEVCVGEGTHQYALNDTIPYVMVLYSQNTNASVSYSVMVETADEESSSTTTDPLLFYHEEAVIVSVVACCLLLITCIVYEVVARKRKINHWDLHCGQPTADIELCKVEDKTPSSEHLCVVPLDHHTDDKQ